jgi:hypothetical protein
MPTDIATMKTRIVSELGGRTDLTSNITDAINDAIDAYQEDRFYFNESRDVTFSTVASQEFYTVADNANIPNILAWDYVMKVVGINTLYLSYVLPDVMEDTSNSGTFIGEPYEYTYYQQKIRLFPVPNAAITIRIGCQIKLAGPTSDTDATNPWIIEAERLIRSRAKFILATHVTLDSAMASAMSPDDGETARAFDELKGRTNRQTGTGTIQAVYF